MGNTYIWDIGFDFTDFQSNGSNSPLPIGNSPLQIGFVQTNTSQGSVPATPVNLQIGDTIGINGFNLTPGATTTDGSSITSVLVSLSDAHTNLPFSPFTTGQVTNPVFNITTGLGTANPQTGSSAIFSGNPPNATMPFPKWWPILGAQTVAQNGNFLMLVVLNVTDPNGNQRIFSVDPQMIIGGAG